MSTAKCYSLVGGTVLRMTALDGCGRPRYGDCAQVVTDGFISFTATAEIDEGDTIEVKNAAGKTCVRKKPVPQQTGYTVEIAFCEVDPDAYAMATGQRTVLDPTTGEAIGFRVNVDVDQSNSGVGIEVWSEVPGVACAPDQEGVWGYTLMPFLQGGVFGDFTIENDAVTFTVTGMATKSGSGWGNGPHDITSNGPLEDAIENGDHLHVQLVNIAPPDETCGCVPLDDPNATDATGATAGTPGTWTPADSNRPDDFAALQGATPAVVASPTTAWTAGQHVILEDGSAAHWDGTVWAEGEAT